MSEELKAMEARLLVAEKALADILTAYELWCCTDNTQKTTIDIMHAIGKIAYEVDLTAAREMIRKAEEWGEVSLLLAGMTIGGSEFVDNPMRCIRHIKRQIGLERGIGEKLRGRVAELEAGRDGLVEMVRVMREALEALSELFRRILRTMQGLMAGEVSSIDIKPSNFHLLRPESFKQIQIATKALALTPAAALDDYRAEVLEEVVSSLRSQLKEFCATEVVYTLIRAMKEAK